MPKIVHFGEFFENLKLAVKQCYQTGQKMVENAKIKNSNGTFWIIFKQCAEAAKVFWHLRKKQRKPFILGSRFEPSPARFSDHLLTLAPPWLLDLDYITTSKNNLSILNFCLLLCFCQFKITTVDFTFSSNRNSSDDTSAEEQVRSIYIDYAKKISPTTFHCSTEFRDALKCYFESHRVMTNVVFARFLYCCKM